MTLRECAKLPWGATWGQGGGQGGEDDTAAVRTPTPCEGGGREGRVCEGDVCGGDSMSCAVVRKGRLVTTRERETRDEIYDETAAFY